MDTFMGKAYLQEIRGHGRQVVYVSNGPGKSWIVVWRDSSGTRHRVVSTLLPPHENADLVQRALDAFAHRYHLEPMHRLCCTCAHYQPDLDRATCKKFAKETRGADRCLDWAPDYITAG